MEPVAQLDQQNPKILRHGHQHFAERRRLLRFLGVESQSIEFRDPVDDCGHLDTEVGGEIVECHPGIFHRVMQQGGGDGEFIEAQLGDNRCDCHRMGDVRLARLTSLSRMGVACHLERSSHEVDLLVATRTLEARYQRADLLTNLLALAFPRQGTMRRDHDHQAISHRL